MPRLERQHHRLVAVPEGNAGAPVRGDDLGGQEIHRRRAHEAGNEHVGGTLIDRPRHVELLQAPLMHHGDARGERHRLDLVVGHVDRGLAECLVQLLDLGPHLDAELGVEIGERLVEQEERRVADQRPAHRDPLALAAGELAGLAIEQAFDLEKLGDARHRRILLRLRHAAALHAEGDVLPHRHRRVERIGLEHHGDVAVLRRNAVDDAAADRDLTRGDRLEAGDHGKQRRLPAAGRPDQHDEFAGLDLEVDAFEDLDRAEPLGEIANAERGHGSLDRTLGKAANEVAAAEEIDEQRWQCCDQHGC